MVVVDAHQARVDRERRSQDGDTRVRARRDADHLCGEHHQFVGGVGLIRLAAAAHQGWSANVYTLTSDMFPKQAIGSVVGFGGTAGAIGGMLIAKVTAAVLQYTGGYLPVFIIAASAYLVALLMVHLLSPRLEPAPIK